MDTSGGHIGRVQIYSDSLLPEMIESLVHDLKGVPYRAAAVKTALEGTADKLPQAGPYIGEFSNWICAQLP